MSKVLYCEVEITRPTIAGGTTGTSFNFFGPEKERKTMVELCQEYFKKKGADGLNFLAEQGFIPVTPMFFYRLLP